MKVSVSDVKPAAVRLTPDEFEEEEIEYPDYATAKTPGSVAAQIVTAVAIFTLFATGS